MHMGISSLTTQQQKENTVLYLAYIEIAANQIITCTYIAPLNLLHALKHQIPVRREFQI